MTIRGPADIRPVVFHDRQAMCISNQKQLALALHKADSGGYRHVPVVDNGKPVGMISVRDILRHLTRLCKDG